MVWQGGERDIIILTCSRTGGIGFLDSPNRMNVALTRARHHLIIVGHQQTLKINVIWKRILVAARKLPLGYHAQPQQLIQLLSTMVMTQEYLAKCGTQSSDSTSDGYHSQPVDEFDDSIDHSIGGAAMHQPIHEDEEALAEFEDATWSHHTHRQQDEQGAANDQQDDLEYDEEIDADVARQELLELRSQRAPNACTNGDEDDDLPIARLAPSTCNIALVQQDAHGSEDDSNMEESTLYNKLTHVRRRALPAGDSTSDDAMECSDGLDQEKENMEAESFNASTLTTDKPRYSSSTAYRPGSLR